MEIEIKLDLETLTKFYKIFIILFFFGFSLWIFYLNYQTVQKYPIVFGDEGFHMRIAKELTNRKEYLYYLEYFKPNPTAYGYFSIFHFLEAFGFLVSEWFARLLLPLTVFLIAFSMFVIFWKVFDEKIALLSSILFQTFQSTVIYSVTFYVDSLLTLFTLLGFGFSLLYFKEKRIEYLILSSIFISLTLITKPTLPSAILASFYLFLIYKLVFVEKNYKHFIYSLIFPTIITLSAILANILIYNKVCISIFPLSEFLNNYLKGSCIIENINYKDKYSFSARTEQIGTEVDVFSMGLTNYLDFAYGYSSFIIFSVLISIVYFAIKKQIEILALLLPLIFLFLYSLTFDYYWYGNLGVFTRAEDTARYLYFSNPFIALYISSIFLILKEFLSVFEKNKHYQKLYIAYVLLFLISLFFISHFFFTSYSQKLDIMQRVKSFSNYFFEACNWVKNNLDKNATLMSLWGHRVVYACERNVGGTADLRLSNNATFINELAKYLGINYFFVEKFSVDPLNRHFAEMYDLSWVELLYNSPEYFEKVYENGIPFEQCKNYWNFGYQCDGVIIFKVK
ncbi:MAG: glycosyltransferase family 39 protein [Candidatus Aenigmatarchaeota archaeon]